MWILGVGALVKTHELRTPRLFVHEKKGAS